MREYVRRTVEELEQEIADLTKARDALLRLDAGPATPAPTAQRAKPGKRRAAKRAAEPKPAEEKAEASDVGVRILKFLDKNGPSRAEAIAPGAKLRPNVVAIGLKKLVRDGLAVDADGVFRATDKGLDAALA